MIDQTQVNLMQLIPTELKKVAGTNGGEYHGACPKCGGKDRFVVQPNARPNPRWFCRQCYPSGGDAIAFLMWYQGLDFKDAANELDLHWLEIQNNFRSQSKLDRPTLSYAREKQTGSDNPRWQARAHAFIEYAQNKMWESDTMRRYLWERGFYDRTIKQYGLGYNPRAVNDDWGLDKKVWLPAGLVIPYEHGEHSTITKIRIRRSDYKPGDTIGKYIPPAGVKNTAYLTRRIQRGDYVVIVEGELDAIIFKQEVIAPHVVALATGGTQGAKLLKYLALLALAQKVIVAFDSDESGNQAAKYWLDALPNAARLCPIGKDINDMVIKDINLYQWLGKVL